MELVVCALAVFVLAIICYYGACHIIKLWTGCNNSEAEVKLHNFFNGTIQYSFCNDVGFANTIWDNIRNVIGDKRYNQLVQLSQTAISTPLLSFGENSGLPYIAISIFYVDDNEKQILESVLTNVVTMYLKTYGFNKSILANWKRRYDLNMPYFEVRYAQTQEEKRILNIELQNNQQNILAINTEVMDDEDNEDLNA